MPEKTCMLKKCFLVPGSDEVYEICELKGELNLDDGLHYYGECDCPSNTDDCSIFREFKKENLTEPSGECDNCGEIFSLADADFDTELTGVSSESGPFVFEEEKTYIICPECGSRDITIIKE